METYYGVDRMLMSWLYRSSVFHISLLCCIVHCYCSLLRLLCTWCE